MERLVDDAKFKKHKSEAEYNSMLDCCPSKMSLFHSPKLFFFIPKKPTQ